MLTGPCPLMQKRIKAMETHKWDQDGPAILCCCGPNCTHFCSGHHITTFPDLCSVVVVQEALGCHSVGSKRNRACRRLSKPTCPLSGDKEEGEDHR